MVRDLYNKENQIEKPLIDEQRVKETLINIYLIGLALKRWAFYVRRPIFFMLLKI